MTLAEGQIGLLLTRAMGYEYRYSAHYLYLAQADRLHEVWTYREGMDGGQRSSTTVIPSRTSGREDIAYLQLRRSHDGRVTELRAQRLRFDPSSRALLATPLPDEAAPLYVLVLQGFEDAQAALQLRSECLRELDVLPRSFFPELPSSFFVGGVFARRQDASATAAELAECPELPKPYIYVQAGEKHARDHEVGR